MSAPEPTGADLARIALTAARAAAKTRPAGPGPKPRRRTTMRRTDGRDPLPLGKAIDLLVTEHGWETPAAGGTIIDQWPQIAPELAGKVTAEAFDAETGCLSLRPSTAAYGAQLRLFARQMVTRIAEKTGTTVVRSLRVLPPGSPTTAPGAAAAADGNELPVAPPGMPGGPPLRTRADASAGMLAAQAIVAEHRNTDHTDPTKESRDRYFGDIRGTLREPEDNFTDAVVIQDDLAERARRQADIELRARAVARAQKAGRTPALPRAFDRTA